MRLTGKVLVVALCTAWVGAAQVLPGSPDAGGEQQPDAGAPLTACVVGTVLSQGTRDVVVLAQVSLEDGGVPFAETGPDGRFSVELPPGEVRLKVSASGHRPRVFTERLQSAQRVEVLYRLERSYSRPYETVVRGQADRAELSRVSLDGAELTEAAGTAGQPLRAVMLLPGVTTPASGLSYPVVRGAVPAATGYFFDGVRIPQLYHLLVGNSVIHTEFIDRLSFFPSTMPARYGRISGAAVAAEPSSMMPERWRLSVAADLLQANAFVDVPIAATGTRVTVAGSANYAGWLLGALSATLLDDIKPVLESNDYQARVEQEVGRGELRLLAFGSTDFAGVRANESGTRPALLGTSNFHRVDLRARYPLGPGLLELGTNVGWERIGLRAGNAPQELRFQLDRFTWTARTSYRVELGQHIQLKAGFDVERQDSQVETSLGVRDGAGLLRQPRVLGVLTGSFLEAAFFTERWTLVAGARVDTWQLPPSLTLVSIDPRLDVRWRATDSLLLRAGAGLAHQAPMLLVSLPISDTAALAGGLQEVGQLSLGGVGSLPWLNLELSGEVFYNHLFHVRERSLTEFATGVSSIDDGLADRRWGRAYGLELMLRLPQQGRLFGWLTYTLMRSERLRRFAQFDEHQNVVSDTTALVPSTFDQTHTVNVTLGYQLPKGFKVSGSFHFHTGRPESGDFGSRTARLVEDPTTGRQEWAPVPLDQVDRLPAFARVDLRVSKTIAFSSFSAELYLDVLNTIAIPEVYGFTYRSAYDDPSRAEKYPVSLPLILPTLGMKVTY